MSNQKTVSVSFPFFSLLALLFIGLKLGGVGAVATWSWWLVLSPLWVPILILLSFGLLALLLWLVFGK